MSVRKRILLAGGIGLFLSAVAVGGLVLALRSEKDVDEYPPSPFQRLPEGRRWRTVDALVAEGDKPVFDALAKEKFVDAYELAAEGLRKSQDSIPLRYAVARCLHQGLTALPDALYVLRKLRHDLEARGRNHPDDETSREWYYHTLMAEADVLSQMDRYAEVLRAADLIDAVGPRDRRIRLWALVKEKRWDEAERAISEAEQDLDPNIRLHGMNTRAAMEGERRRRTASLQASRKARDAFPGSAVLESNLGLASIMAFDFAGAEQAWRKSTQLPNDFYGTPWLYLADFLLQAGKVSEVYAALENAKAHRFARKPFTRIHDEAQFKAVFATFLLVLGRSEEAELRVRGVAENPDRTGMTSADKVQIELKNRILLWLALKMRAEQFREEECSRSWFVRTLPNPKVIALEAEAWTERCRILRLVEKEDRLKTNLRPYLSENSSPWVAASLVQLLPPGVAYEAVRQAREAEEDPKANPYFDALAAEAALLLSRYDEALGLASQALAGLSTDGEKLLRARISAVAAEALRRTDRTKEALEHFSVVLRDFPGVTRMLDLSIPVKTEHDDSALSRRLAEALERSPRFRSDPEGFPVRVWMEASQLRFVMELPGGPHHFEPDGVALEADADATILAAVRRFHQRVMSPKIDLTSAQINSLDGLQAAKEGGRE